MKYGKKEKLQDALAGAALMFAMFLLVWFAFAADVQTTGM